MQKGFKLRHDIKNLLLKDKFYLKIKRGKNKIKYEKNYHKNIIDPDGKKRNLLIEKKYKLKQFKYILSFLKKQKPGKILDIGCGHKVKPIIWMNLKF